MVSHTIIRVIKYFRYQINTGGRGSVVRVGHPITWRLAVWFPLSLLKRLMNWQLEGWRSASEARYNDAPPCSLGAVIGCPPLQCMASVSMSVWPCAGVCSTGVNLDGLNAEEKCWVFRLHDNLILILNEAESGGVESSCHPERIRLNRAGKWMEKKSSSYVPLFYFNQHMSQAFH